MLVNLPCCHKLTCRSSSYMFSVCMVVCLLLLLLPPSSSFLPPLSSPPFSSPLPPLPLLSSSPYSTHTKQLNKSDQFHALAGWFAMSPGCIYFLLLAATEGPATSQPADVGETYQDSEAGVMGRCVFHLPIKTGTHSWHQCCGTMCLRKPHVHACMHNSRRLFIKCIPWH